MYIFGGLVFILLIFNLVFYQFQSIRRSFTFSITIDHLYNTITHFIS